jgi:hypothetical protein
MIGLLVTPVTSSKRPPGISTHAFSRLEEFEGMACRELLSGDDWNRFFDFITAAHQAPEKICAKDLHRWFVIDRGWPDEAAGDLCHFFERSCALLRHAGIS